MKKANAYKYDQLNRIAQSNSFTNFDVANNKWMFGGAIANMYKTSYTYDANGNIKNLQRCNAAGVKFDDMTYRYDEQNGNLISNKLYHVNDAIASGIHTADIDDEGTYNTTNVTTANNYTYDAIGNLTKDVSEQIQNIEWSVSGKIKKIIRTGISTKADLEYVYDAMGNRIAKILKPDGSSLENGGTDNPNLWTYTYYVRDAQGNIMANYQKSTTNSITSFKLIERSIYGSSRLGIDKTSIDLTASTTPPTILNHNLGLKNYELSNHLGNVTTVISDRKIPRSVLGTNIDFYMPDIVSATDYYPFGMTMQERTFSAGGAGYRFGFNGQEKENEINSTDGGHLAFEYRIHDARLGRFLSVDPLSAEYPWNSSYAFAENRCIDGIDLEGKEYVNSTTNNAPGTCGPLTPEGAAACGATPATEAAQKATTDLENKPAQKAMAMQKAFQANAGSKGIPQKPGNANQGAISATPPPPELKASFEMCKSIVNVFSIVDGGIGLANFGKTSMTVFRSFEGIQRIGYSGAGFTVVKYVESGSKFHPFNFHGVCNATNLVTHSTDEEYNALALGFKVEGTVNTIKQSYDVYSFTMKGFYLTGKAGVQGSTAGGAVQFVGFSGLKFTTVSDATYFHTTDLLNIIK